MTRRSRRELEREVERLGGSGRGGRSDRAEDWRAYITGAITPEEWSARREGADR